MKKEHTSLFANLWDAKSKSTDPVKSIPVFITQYSQPHVLQQRMKEAHLTHGQTVRGDISPVRLEASFGKMVLYFCPAHGITVNEQITPGDGGPIPPEAILEGVVVPGTFTPGYYHLKNAKFFSNGTMQLIADENTIFEEIKFQS